MDLYQLACLQAQADLPQRFPAVAQYLTGQQFHPSAPFKALELWQELVRFRPKSILEIGCGMTTLVFALYAKKYGATVVSTEDNAEYMENVRTRLGDVAEFVTLLPVEKRGGDIPCHIEHGIGFETPDLLYVDGPSNPSGGMCGDAHNLVSSGQLPKWILFDFRFATVKDFMDRHSDKYEISVGWAGRVSEDWYLSGFKHHSIARRR